MSGYEIRFFWPKGKDHGRAINLRKLGTLHFSKVEKRTDDYLCLGNDNVGVKWRGGSQLDLKPQKLELKHRERIEADGVAELWTKYVLPDESKLIDKLKDLNVFAEPKNDQSLSVFPLRTIHKKRRHALLNGCTVEQAELKIDARDDESTAWFGRRWRSVALEAATAAELVSGLEVLMKLAPRLAQAREEGRLYVMAYPGFLSLIEKMAQAGRMG